MAVSEAQQRAVAKYVKKNYDEITIRVTKGKRDELREVAQGQGKSLNAYIIAVLEADSGLELK